MIIDWSTNQTIVAEQPAYFNGPIFIPSGSSGTGSGSTLPTEILPVNLFVVRQIHVGDVGIGLLVAVKDENYLPLNISSATLKQILLQPLGGTTQVKTAALYTDGTDGKMIYVTQASDLNVSGSWQLQGKVTLPSGTQAGTYSTDVLNFNVAGNLL